jgi:hypothetical protein
MTKTLPGRQPPPGSSPCRRHLGSPGRYSFVLDITFPWELIAGLRTSKATLHVATRARPTSNAVPKQATTVQLPEGLQVVNEPHLHAGEPRALVTCALERWRRAARQARPPRGRRLPVPGLAGRRMTGAAALLTKRPASSPEQPGDRTLAHARCSTPHRFAWHVGLLSPLEPVEERQHTLGEQRCRSGVVRRE